MQIFRPDVITAELGYINPWFVQHLIYKVIHSVVPHNSPQGTWFSALLSMTYTRASNSEIPIMPVFVYHIILQEVGYFENSIISSSLRR